MSSDIFDTGKAKEEIQFILFFIYNVKKCFDEMVGQSLKNNCLKTINHKKAVANSI